MQGAVTSQRVVALILSSMTAYRMNQILCAEKYFQARVGETKEVTFRAKRLAEDSLRSTMKQGKDKVEQESGVKGETPAAASRSAQSSTGKKRRRAHSSTGKKRRRAHSSTRKKKRRK